MKKDLHEITEKLKEMVNNESFKKEVIKMITFDEYVCKNVKDDRCAICEEKFKMDPVVITGAASKPIRICHPCFNREIRDSIYWIHE